MTTGGAEGSISTRDLVETKSPEVRARVRSESKLRNPARELSNVLPTSIPVSLISLYHIAQREIALKNCPLSLNWSFIMLFGVERQ